MLTTMETYLRARQRKLHRFFLEPGVQSGMKVLGYGGSAFLLSAAAPGGVFQPLAAALVTAVRGWQTLVMTAGAMVGYRLFWGSPGIQGMVWAGISCILTLLEREKWRQELPLLLPALLSVGTAVTGLSFLFLQGTGDFSSFFLRVGLVPVAAWFFRRASPRYDQVSAWICAGLGALALARIAPIPGLNLGCAAGAVLGVWASFPAAAMAGLALDLAEFTPVPMAAVLCIGWFARMLPFEKRWMRCVVPTASALAVMALCGKWDLLLLPGLALGGIVGYSLPPRPDSIHRRGQTGVAQVRLELTAGVLSQTQQLLLEYSDPPVDEAGLVDQIRLGLCGDCVHRDSCREQSQLSTDHLKEPSAFTCRRHKDMQQQLNQARRWLLTLKADRQRRQEYRSALIQQYQFLSGYLRQLADQLPRQAQSPGTFYRLEVSARSKGKEKANGDSCMAFPGTGCRYYIALCDGMGTGLGASREGESAGGLLHRMLTAGFPPEHALRSINSILTLRSQAGAVTLDLAEIRLDCGRVTLYKWGAAPSYVIRKTGSEKIGTATPPPGFRITDARETVYRLSLRRGEVLILLSDGAEAGECLRRMDPGNLLPPGELAQRILEECSSSGEDDATAAVVRLKRRRMVT